MAAIDRIVTETRDDVAQMMRHIDEAKALAARATAKVTAMGGAAAATSGYEWPADFDGDDFANVVSTLANHVPTFVTQGHDTNIYKFLLAIG